MKSTELLRKLKKLAKKRGLELTIAAAKGSHRKVYFGEAQSVIPEHANSELKTGTLKGILKQLGIEEKDLYES
ncbi:MAG TPA: type II toxin-antitoxin system HicA family toxin [Bryobacteraceae bacterium]|jgi:mRNA interferase HicA|nr:type II toxin-antitoxin system HicA family toxin [Bryobacteraceae bacterium]